MAENNPLVLFETLDETLKRYIPTTLPISRRYPKLQQAFRNALIQQELVKGPYVEALPDFEKGRPLSALLRKNEGFLHDALQALPEHILNRPLHLHQEEALTAACRDGQSLIVATGTGSGKTETFLYPLAQRLLDDPEPDVPGVRCLLIYPMNALANDQLYYRIAPLFGGYLADHALTFGRFTSQTPNDRRRDDEEFRLQDNEKLMRALGNRVPHNWLLTRREMLTNPPKILITNYAMLEHLLLLPRNAPLFAHNRLQSVVLDEIHTYSGAQATEVAFLLRKLKTQLNIQKPLQVFGTSASFPSGENNDQKILAFANNLFGEKVQRVVRGRRIPHQDLQKQDDDLFSLAVGTWADLSCALKQHTGESLGHDIWEELLEDADLADKIPSLSKDLAFPQALQKCFAYNRELRRASDKLDQGGVIDFSELAETVFKGYPGVDRANRTAALSGIMHIGMLARQNPEDFPLLPGRYHLAVSSIEGVSVRLAEAEEGWRDIKLLRQHQGEDGVYYPLLVCRKCGQPYIEGFESGGRLLNRRPLFENSHTTRRVLWLGTPPPEHLADEEDENEENASEYQQIRINPVNGEIGNESLRLYRVETRDDEEERRSYVQKCPACGGRASGTDAEIVTRMHPGNEALCSVVVQKVLDALPPQIDKYEPQPMQGRSLLTFSDNRQDAAFFAPYFERTAGDMALRSAICRVLQQADEPMDLELLAEQVHKLWRKIGQPVLLNERGEIRSSWQECRDLLLGRIAAEFCTPGGRRNSLEALGLVRVTYEAAKLKRLRNQLLSAIPEAFHNQVDALIHLLLENIRREKALGNFYDLDMSSLFIWGEPYAGHRAFEIQKLDKKISHAWLPTGNRQNRRTWYLAEQLRWPREEALDFLRNFWEAATQVKLLTRLKPGFGLDGKLLRFTSGEPLPLYICESCGLLQTDTVNKRCTAFGCKGHALKLSEAERNRLHEQNHYIHSYRTNQSTTARAREHTASLATELREKIEQEFAEGKVNLLSCTTTMEMGVDLGDLEAVANLNVPPGIANYQQRTGRAGRRAQAAPFCVTVARNSQYDQAMFHDFRDYLSREAPIPFISLDNPILFRRHQNGMMLSAFLRYRITGSVLEKNAPGLNDLFGENFGPQERQDFVDDLTHWLDTQEGQDAIGRAEKLAEAPGIPSSLGLSGETLKHFFQDNLWRFAQEVYERWHTYTQKKEEALQQEGDEAKKLSRAQRWVRLRDDYMKQFLVNQFSQRSLIPTYSFPTHALNLEVAREFGRQPTFGASGDITLSRDAALGISEYAPGAEVIANGRIWQSAGLAQYPRMFMPTEYYAACPQCHHVDTAVSRDDLPPACSHCGNTDNRQRRAYIEPRGFVTAYAQRHGKDPGSNRRRERPAEEARLITLPTAEQFNESDHSLLCTALLRAQPGDDDSAPGRLFIVNKGPRGVGYHHCLLCNYAEAATQLRQIRKTHRAPLTDEPCREQTLYYQDFAHTFSTDVLLMSFRQLPPTPPTDADPDTAGNFRERFARTLAEAIRFAAAETLNIPSFELRATFRMNGPYVETLLYDAVAGGAGYCISLHRDTAMQTLLEQACRRLECPRQCSSGCSACLCDYSNQRAWDMFERRPVLEWLQGFVQQTGTNQWTQSGAVRWERPSLNGLRERLAGFDELHLFGTTLDGETEIDAEGTESTLRWLLDWLHQRKRLHFYLLRGLSDKVKDLNTNQRNLVRYFYPYVEKGQVSFRFVRCHEAGLDNYPRLFVSPQAGSPAWFSPHNIVPLFDRLLPNPIYQHKLDTVLSARLSDLIQAGQPYPLKGLQPITRWELQAGEARNLTESCFAALKNAHIEKLTVRDPYCGTENGRKSLKELLDSLADLAAEIGTLQIHCLEQNRRDFRYLPPYQVKKELETQFAGITKKLDITVHPFSEKRRFHDRVVDVCVINQTGNSVLHRYDLTGGIDYLMDSRKATKIFHYQTVAD